MLSTRGRAHGRRALVRRRLSAALLALLPAVAFAVDVDYQVGASVLHSDNIGLVETNEESDTVLSPRLHFEATQDSSAVQMKARGDIAYLYYTQSSFSDELRGELAGELTWSLLPQRMDLVVRDYLNRQPINVLTGFSPGNQQEVNVFIAGPTFYSRFSDATLAQLDLRYGNSYAEESEDFDGDRYNVAGRILRDINATTSVSFNAEATQVDYDTGSASTDYKRYDAYFGFIRTLAALDLSLDVGWTKVDLEDGISDDMPTGRLNLGWRMTPSSKLDANVDYEFGDAAQNTISRVSDVNGTIISDFSNADVIVGPGVFELQRYDVGYRYGDERFDLHLRPYYQSFDYLDATIPDQTSRGGVAELGYQAGPLTRLSLLIAYERREFDQLLREDEDMALYLSLVRQFTRHWSWQVDLQHRERDSTDLGMSYDENAIVFAINYSR